jgi:DNA-binding NarL/FixJ family response regulator
VDQISTVQGDLELLARAGHLFTGVQEDFWCAARDLDTWSMPEVRQSVKTRLRSIRTRKLLSPVALTTQDSREHLRLVMAHGAQVRITATPLPQETIIMDRRVMILAGPDSPRGRDYSITSSPTLVGGVVALFEAAWEAATDLDVFFRGELPHLDADGRAVLRSLGDGLTDAAAARKLGLSLRTYRRRVAELLAVLDADSRFQAGLRAGELGLTGAHK